MAEKASETKSTTPTPSTTEPANTESGEKKGKGEFVVEGQESYEKGYWGLRENPHDDEEFTLQTGPNSPLQDARGNPAVDAEGNEISADEHIQKEPKE